VSIKINFVLIIQLFVKTHKSSLPNALQRTNKICVKYF